MTLESVASSHIAGLYLQGSIDSRFQVIIQNDQFILDLKFDLDLLVKVKPKRRDVYLFVAFQIA